MRTRPSRRMMTTRTRTRTMTSTSLSLTTVDSRHSRNLFKGRVVRDDTKDFVGNVAYNVPLTRKNGEHYVLSPKLTEDEELQVAVLVSAEEEKRAFSRLEDALFLSVAPPPPP
jgi:hypothetical protein